MKKVVAGYKAVPFRAKVEIFTVSVAGVLFAVIVALLIVNTARGRYAAERLQTIQNQNDVLRSTNAGLLRSVGALATAMKDQAVKDSIRAEIMLQNQKTMLENQKVAPLVPQIANDVKEIKKAVLK